MKHVTTADRNLGGQLASERKRTLLIKAGIILGFTVYALIFGELFFRYLYPRALIPRFVTGGEDGIRINMSNIIFRQSTPEVDVLIHYNDYGMRDDRPAPAVEKGADDCRVALLGDSFMVGFESNYSDSFPMQLEQALGKRGLECRVLNFAVSGFGAAEMLIAMQARVKKWQPNLIIASIHRTDGQDNIRSGLFRLEKGQVISTGMTYLPGVDVSNKMNQYEIYRWMEQNCQLYTAIRDLATRAAKQLVVFFRKIKSSSGVDDGLESDEAAMVGSRPLNVALVRAMLDQAKRMDANLLFLDIPTRVNRIRYVSTSANLLGSDVYASLPHVDLVDRFNEIADPMLKLYWEMGNSHWTPRGNKEAAEATADEILAANLLK